MIDLHLHTTASDGADTPAELVRACRGGRAHRRSAVTDHDTMAAISEVATRGRACRDLTFVPGIEITAAWRAEDVHVLGYFLDRAFAGPGGLPRRSARGPHPPRPRDRRAARVAGRADRHGGAHRAQRGTAGAAPALRAGDG